MYYMTLVFYNVLILLASSNRRVAQWPRTTGTRGVVRVRAAKGGARAKRKKKKREIQCVPAGGSDFVHCHCNFLAGCSFRGVPHHRGITYRWLFVRMSPRVIICLVTRPATAYLAGLFLFRFSLALHRSVSPSLSRDLLFLPVNLFIFIFFSFSKPVRNTREMQRYSDTTCLFEHVN